MRKLGLYGIIVFQLLMIASLIRGIQLSRLATNRITEMEKVKNKLTEEKNQLVKQGEYVQSDFYLEKVARDELHLSKEGEIVVMVSDNQTAIPELDQSDGISINKPNWQKWWEVLSGK